MQQITGKLLQVLPVVTGENERGIWQRGGFVIDTGGEYPKKVAFTLFGENRIGQVQPTMIGCVLQVNFTPESREYGDKWYTDLRAQSVAVVGAAVTAQQPVQQPANTMAQPLMPKDGELPF